jgi:anthranilate phosphoribosyltransferase
MGPTEILHLKDGQFTNETLDPVYYGIPRADYNSLVGGNADINAGIIKNIISGNETGPRKDIVVLNAAAAIIVSGLADNFAQGIELANQALVRGSAAKCLESLVQISNS